MRENHHVYTKYRNITCNRCGTIDCSYQRDSDGFIIRRFRDKYNLSTQLTIHHIDHNRNNDAPENLETLCTYCHNEEHVFDYFFKNEYLISKGSLFNRQQTTN